ncbi:MAG TPA: excalibur calcium-binding domain-containing protein [Sphingomicrobium sp.]|nr:excalibur calcium-binding domain-containing protein [Sphingomicrobium sp.]
MRLPSAVALLASSLCITWPVLPAQAHPGGLNAEGCHNNRKTGEYHCHRPTTAARAGQRPFRAISTASSFRNCSEARAAGAAPVRAGDAGYSRKLDRDGDGVGCE